MIVTRAGYDDINALPGIYNRAMTPFYAIFTREEKEAHSPENVFHFMNRPQDRELICAKQDGIVAGYATFRLKNMAAIWISSLYVDPCYQNNGYGSAMLDYIDMFARRRTCVVAGLETHPKAVWAIDFYRRNGYDVVNDKLDRYPYSFLLDKPAIPNRPILAKVIS